MLTNLNSNAEGAGHFAISPDGEAIGFQHLTAAKGESSAATFVYDYQLVTMPARGGPLHSLANLGDHASMSAPPGSWPSGIRSEQRWRGGVRAVGHRRGF